MWEHAGQELLFLQLHREEGRPLEPYIFLDRAPSPISHTNYPTCPKASSLEKPLWRNYSLLPLVPVFLGHPSSFTYWVVCPHQNCIPWCLSQFPPLLILSTIHLHFLNITDSSPASFPPSGDAYLCPGTKVSASASIIDPILSLHTPRVKFSVSDALFLKSPAPVECPSLLLLVIYITPGSPQPALSVHGRS